MLTVTVEDANGNPIPNAYVEAYSQDGSTPLYPDGTNDATGGVSSYARTNTNGVANVVSFQGLSFGQRFGPTNEIDNICAQYIGTTFCIASPLTVNSSNVSVIIQQ